ncbi:sigma-70 family RNA polymerase sigma factor [Rhodococcus hoagii]|nr:sigma-70 family RNA polymerase sigma factor [Prescottella equi]NKR80603.1 sigma-70 family RNA polymerase sigma factor [Prescottella equi]NKS99465.1 sigma-70 family RNA polymerase sigma factor [Prescottella equi]
MTDGELLALCRQGYETAFGELVGRYRNRLWSICFRVTGNREDAEEAVQDTLTSAWQNLHKFRGDAKVSTWLYRIAANASLAIVRKRKDTVVDDFDVIELEDPAPMTADRVADVDAVRRALAELPEDFRVAVVLREFAEMSYADIAEHQGIPVATVKTRINRARKQLITLLAPTQTG